MLKNQHIIKINSSQKE